MITKPIRFSGKTGDRQDNPAICSEKSIHFVIISCGEWHLHNKS